MTLMDNRVKLQYILLGLIIEPDSFAFEAKVILGLEITHLDG